MHVAGSAADVALTCPFCVIVSGDDAALEIYRDVHIIAFFPLAPAALGHTLVIPTEHVPDIWSLNDVLAAELAAAVLRLAKIIRSTVGPDGLSIIQSNGSAATQSVNHLHIHLVPRYRGDSLGPNWSSGPSISEDMIEEIWQEMRRAVLNSKLLS